MDTQDNTVAPAIVQPAAVPAQGQVAKTQDKKLDSISKKLDEMSLGENQIKLSDIEGYKDLKATYVSLEDVVEDLDGKLNKVLRKQEYEYLQAYNIYVKRKEKDLRDMIDKLDEKNSKNNFKDLKIQQQEVTIDRMREDAQKYEQKQEALKKEIKMWKEKLKIESEEKEFFHKQALDAKRKNKLLKVAIGRLQVEREDIKKAAAFDVAAGSHSVDEKDTDTFLTGTKVDAPNAGGIDNFENSQAIVEQNLMANPQYNRGSQQASRQQTDTSYSKRAQSQGMKQSVISRYRNIPSENLKFQQFIDLIFDSRMNKEDIKFEIISYIQALETNYNSTISEHKVKNERTRNMLRKEKAKHVNDVIDRGDLENLFVDCVEDVRRNVIKRRLKAEIVGKKKIGKFDEHSAEAREFEESLLKLANLAKDRVKFSEFTSQDRNHLLDLFVNNERTLMRMYEVLFPRKSGGQGTAFKVNSLKQMSIMKNSSDTIQIGNAFTQKSDLLKGDSILQRSIDDTQAGTDHLNQSTVLPSIMPAMNSIQSNDIISSHLHNRSSNVNNVMGSPEPDRLREMSVQQQMVYQQSLKKNLNQHSKGLSMNVDPVQRSAILIEGKKSAFNL